MAALSLDLRGFSFPAVGRAPAHPVLGSLRLTVEPGVRLGIIGPSGCGKTTLLNIVAGLIGGIAGRVELAPGTRLAYVFQEPRLLPWRTVEDNLRLVLPERPDPAARIATALAEVGLAGHTSVFASRLSLGMARRAALARAFVIEPSLLLLDEPFVSLDEPTAQRLRLLLLDLLDRHGATALFVTHSLHEAIMLADRLLFLSPAPGGLLGLHDVELAAAGRRQPQPLEEFRLRLLAENPQLARLLVPALEPVA